MIVVVDYGRNNVRSVHRALTCVGAHAEISADPQRVRTASGLVLPGVGSFASGMQALRESGLACAIREGVGRGVPLLGICLGMQMLFESSEESGLAGQQGDSEGFSLLQGRIRRFDGGQKVPHVGWNEVRSAGEGELLVGRLDGSYMYFTHSYYLPLTGSSGVVGMTDYGVGFVSVVRRGNVIGTQFHPEKSGAQGLELIGRLVRIMGSGTM